MKTILIAVFAMAAIPAWAGPERIAYPAGYAQGFLLYNQIERPDRKPNQIRFMYVNRAPAQAAKAGAAVPNGTILIMEDREAKMNTDGRPLRDAQGRLVGSDKVLTVWVQQKEAGWGTAYPAEKRNGDWDYAVFNADGTPRANANFDGCFACHASRAGRDYTFTFVKWLIDGKP